MTLCYGVSRGLWGRVPLSFDTKMVHIGELFADANVFVMPPFQRPYCWGEEASQLYDDISSAMMRGEAVRTGRKNRQEYFLGPIIVTRGQAPGVLEVIDGQQRLATLAILLAILRDALPGDREFAEELQQFIVRPAHRLRRFPESPRVKLRDNDQGRFFAWVQTEGGTNHLPDDELDDSDASARIREAITRILGDIGNPQDAYIKQLARFIINNCYVIQITSRDRVLQCLRSSPVQEWRSVAMPWLALNPNGYQTLQFLYRS